LRNILSQLKNVRTRQFYLPWEGTDKSFTMLLKQALIFTVEINLLLFYGFSNAVLSWKLNWSASRKFHILIVSRWCGALCVVVSLKSEVDYEIWWLLLVKTPKDSQKSCTCRALVCHERACAYWLKRIVQNPNSIHGFWKESVRKESDKYFLLLSKTCQLTIQMVSPQHEFADVVSAKALY
jgi:hypothetical protein